MSDNRNKFDCSRRRFVSSISAIAAGVALLPPKLYSAGEVAAKPTAIDMHHHFVPPTYKTVAADWLRSHATGLDPVFKWTPEITLENMDRAGIETAAVSISAPGVWFGDDNAARLAASQCNDFAAKMVSDHPGRFHFFTTLPLPDVAGSVAEIARGYNRPGAIGVGLISSYEGRYLDDPMFLPLFEELDRRGALVYVHPTVAPCCVSLTPNVHPAIMEFPIDTGRAIASMLWGGIFSRFRKIQFIFSHGGGILPMMVQRVAAMGQIRPELGARVPEGPMAAIARLYVDTASVTNEVAFAAMRKLWPEDHILFGTDFPWGSPERSMREFRDLNLSEATKTAVVRENASRLLATRSG